MRIYWRILWTGFWWNGENGLASVRCVQSNERFMDHPIESISDARYSTICLTVFLQIWTWRWSGRMSNDEKGIQRVWKKTSTKYGTGFQGRNHTTREDSVAVVSFVDDVEDLRFTHRSAKHAQEAEHFFPLFRQGHLRLAHFPLQRHLTSTFGSSGDDTSVSPFGTFVFGVSNGMAVSSSVRFRLPLSISSWSTAGSAGSWRSSMEMEVSWSFGL